MTQPTQSVRNLLVVDDDNTFRDLMQHGVDERYKVQVAVDGVEALQLLEKEMPDMILLDIRMPRMNGVEFLEKLNEKYPDKHVPIIITSNDSSLDTISRGAELGVRGYIVKSGESMKTIMDSIERVFAEMK